MVTVFVSLALAALSVSAASADSDLHSAQTFVRVRCSRTAVPPATSMWVQGFKLNALVGDCGGGDGRAQHVWFFIGKRFIGNDAPNSSHEIIALWRDEETITFLYVLYRPTDPECCPTGGGAIVRFRWNGKRLVRLDRLPPRAQFSGRVRIGR
jgi:hypothetical protein